MGGRFAAGGAAGVQGHGNDLDSNRSSSGQLYEDTTDFLNLFVLAQKVLVAQQVAETELLGLGLGLTRV